MSTQIVRVPDIGGAEDVEVIEISVSVGDQVAEEDSLVVLESDKASVDIPSPLTGTVVAINVVCGDNLSEGDALVELDVGNIIGDPKQQAATETTTKEPVLDFETQVITDDSEELEVPILSDAVTTELAVEKIEVPDIGGAEDAEVIEVCVEEGDEVESGDSLIVLETDKASMEVPAPEAGTVVSVLLSEGDKASEGTVILTLQMAVPTLSEESSPPEADSNDEIDIPVLTSNVDEPAEKPAKVTSVDSAPKSQNAKTPKSSAATKKAAKPKETVAEAESKSTIDKQPEENPSEEKQSDIPAPAFATLPSSNVSREDQKDEPRKSTIYAGPAVRKLARELGVDLTTVIGHGPKGRIAKDDLKAHVKLALSEKSQSVSHKESNKGPVESGPVANGTGIPTIPAVDFSLFGEIEAQALNKIQKLTAANMQRSWLNVPHVTQFDDADISDLEDFRKSLKSEADKLGLKITPLPFLLKACAKVLKTYPKFNASLDSDCEHLIYKKYINIGMAVDTPAGLVVPVIRDVDKKSIWDLAQETAELANKAKERKLKPQEMQGGCFTISSLGGIGGQGFTPIVNTPELGILGVSKMAIKPVWNGSEFEPRKMLPLALSYDHRAINGVDGGNFLTELTILLSDIRRVVL